VADHLAYDLESSSWFVGREHVLSIPQETLLDVIHVLSSGVSTIPDDEDENGSRAVSRIKYKIKRKWRSYCVPEDE
jgi:hypothetical protein